MRIRVLGARFIIALLLVVLIFFVISGLTDPEGLRSVWILLVMDIVYLVVTCVFERYLTRRMRRERP